MNTTTQNSNTSVNSTAANSSGKLASVKVPDFCLSNFLVAPAAKQSKAIKPSDKDKKAAAVEMVVEQGVALSKQHEKYNEDYIVRGNKALYEVLEAIYAYALGINESALKERIVERMKAVLKDEHKIKTTAKTPWLTTVVKFIVRTDRQTASNYSRVLQVAFDEDLAADALAAYIERRGGVAKIRETEAAAVANGNGTELQKERTELVRRLLLGTTPGCKHKFVYEGDVLQLPTKLGGDAAKEKDESTPTFRHFLAVEGAGNEFYIVGANDFSKKFEDVILKHMSQAFQEDMLSLRAGVERLEAEKRKWQDDEHAKRQAKGAREDKKQKEAAPA